MVATLVVVKMHSLAMGVCRKLMISSCGVGVYDYTL